ncbi:hypothetical protein [Burkholderia sp. MBR-1]|uniref:hypothetical protein n=1 Tax=Burkholderia sp. MBR-1 TaxID=2732364 RepID=UPI0015EFC193|nr:hypothetical protein [Burkholderia sp. MBR-1]QMI49684.1 hypothetical protein MBR110_29815 [Burkholderia sp. MBR-1]
MLIVATGEMSGDAVAKQLRASDPDVAWPAGEVHLLRVRVALCKLAEYGWLKRRERAGIVYYRYAKRKLPRPNISLFSYERMQAQRDAAAGKGHAAANRLHACFFSISNTTASD